MAVGQNADQILFDLTEGLGPGKFQSKTGVSAVLRWDRLMWIRPNRHNYLSKD